MIDWLQNWFKSQCDSEWEHDWGIRIETLDNPGWSIEIDLTDTNVSLDSKQWKLFESKNETWMGYKIENNIFKASGDPQRLVLMIDTFKTLVEQGQLDDQELLVKLESN